MSSNTRLVFSTDPKDQVRCDKCKSLKSECKCIKEVDPKASNFTVNFRIEKNGRGGKTVTVMAGWPVNESYLKEMTKTLKAKCGSGGTYRIESGSGTIEVQGDHRDAIKKYFETKNIKFKGH